MEIKKLNKNEYAGKSLPYGYYSERSKIDQMDGKVTLCPMTRGMCHVFYKGFRNDPAIGHYYEYVYTPEIADRYFDTNTVPDRRLFAILVEGQIVGECKLKHIDMEKRECSMGIHYYKSRYHHENCAGFCTGKEPEYRI